MTGLPAGWRMLSLNEVAHGGLFSDGDWVETKDQDPQGSVRLTQLADVGVGEFRDRSSRWLREDQAASLRCTFLRPSDVLIARMPDPIGRACLVPDGIGRAITAVDVAILRVIDPDIESRYVMWAVNNPKFRATVESLQSGTTRKRISRKNLASLAIPIPPLPEQRRIVDILEDHLSRLDASQAILGRSAASLPVLNVSVLSDIRRSLLDSSTPLKPLGAVCDTALGKMLDAKKARGTPTPYLRNISVRWGSFDLTDVKTVALSDAERMKFEVIPGDLLVCEGGEPGRCAVWSDGPTGMTYQKALHRVRAQDPGKVTTAFVALMLEEFIRTGRADRMFTGTTIKHLPQEKLRIIEFPIPDLTMQSATVDRLTTHAEATTRLTSEMGRIKAQGIALRRALLGAAFSGRLTGRASDMEMVEEMASV